MRRLVAAIGIAIIAWALYHATLLPGFDFGDTGFFQTKVGSPTLTPRDGYPLYFGIGAVFLWLTGADPARALNLASALEGSVACALVVLAGAELSASVAAGVAAGLLFAVSYTFWSQAIIAEVYALHAIFVGLTVLLILSWARRPSMPRLAMFFAVYALGFGNHLSMILLMPGFAAFLMIAAPDGWTSMLRPRVVALALGIAALGALQYSWNLRGLWEWPNHPTLGDAVRTFWFDVTKSDWRETMVLELPPSMSMDRVRMYGFDVLQQFGWLALLAPLGLARLFSIDWRRALLMTLLYVVNFGFAFTYNVGDSHVFYLPSHLVLAVLIAPGITLVARRGRATVFVAAAVVAIAALRGYRDFPALDRSDDHRPATVLADLTRDLDSQHAILLADLNWQLVNGLAYFGKVVDSDLAYDWISHVLLYAPALVRDNRAIGRDVAVTERARAALAAAYGPLLPTTTDPRVGVSTLTEVVRDLPPGTRYVLCVLKPSRDLPLDEDDLSAATAALTGASLVTAKRDYAAIVGTVGNAPAFSLAADVPFTRRIDVAGVTVEVRMESWLAFDTIRRMGFGQVVAAHHHTLIVERGVSFAAFDAQGRPIRVAYRSNIFAPQHRYLVAD